MNHSSFKEYSYFNFLNCEGRTLIIVRRATERGHVNLGWLQSKHTFSFGEYHDPNFMGFGPLRVINEDRVEAGKGFGAHAHQDMEIISYVVDGALEHKDSLGTGSVLRPGDVQRMSAGTGVRHSEFNHSKADVVHFLQIWIIPEKSGLAPSYEEKTFSESEKHGRLRLIGSNNGRGGSLTIHQDISLYACILNQGESTNHNFEDGRIGWLQVVLGSLTINDSVMTAGDGAFVKKAQSINIATENRTEFLLFDMAP